MGFYNNLIIKFYLLFSHESTAVAGPCSCMCSVVARGNPRSSALTEGPNENNAVINRRYYMAARRFSSSVEKYFPSERSTLYCL